MTRDELNVPGIPHIRLSAIDATDSVTRIPSPHVVAWNDSQTHTAGFTVATRSMPVPEIPVAESPVPQVNSSGFSVPVESQVETDVRFVTRSSAKQPSLEEMALQAFHPGQSPLIGGVPSHSNIAKKGSDYPYWVVACVQIVIGTLLIILVVKFANLVRESTDFAPREVRMRTQPASSLEAERSRVSLLGLSEPSRQSTPFRPYGF
ncbi:MAG: hypothetical protein Q8M16_19805 [Pirellulaceae bacterium]|nr:hypothetical protein [Pirellulaceae bacterium]